MNSPFPFFQLNIQAETPSELLNQSKEIVLRHKELQNEATRLGAEVNTLERQNESLVCRMVIPHEIDKVKTSSVFLPNKPYCTKIS